MGARGRGLAGGNAHTCAIVGVGSVDCWGNNGFGGLGDGTLTDRVTPVAVVGLTDAVEVSAGSSFVCARRSAGSVVCWGNNISGQLGDGTGGTETNRLTPVAVVGLTDAVEISAGAVHACARRASGSVVCWGLNTYGQLGDGSMTDRSAPVRVSLP